MITTDFAPNETIKDAILSTKLILQPWRWVRGGETAKVKRRLRSLFFSNDVKIHMFLTGRSALYFFLQSLNLEKKSKILVQAFTCEAVILPILENGLEPVYIDINRDDFSMNITDLKKKLSPESKVLILQHTFGITPKDRLEILSFAKKSKLMLIEDVAHGFDKTLFQKDINSNLLMSFGRSKTMSSVFGGAMVTKNKKISKALSDLELRVPSPSYLFLLKMALYKPISYLIKLTYDIYLGKIIHFFTKQILLIPEITKKEKSGKFDRLLAKSFPNLCAILLLEQLNTFNDVSAIRTRNTTEYHFRLGGENFLNNLTLLRFPVLVNDAKKIKKELAKKKIYLGNWYTQVVAPQGLDLTKMKYTKGSCPVAEDVGDKILNLPTNTTKSETDKIIKNIISRNI